MSGFLSRVTGVSLNATTGVLTATTESGGTQTIGTILQLGKNLADVSSPSIARANLNQGVVPLTYGATVSTNAAMGNFFTLTAAGAFTLANPASMVAGATYIWSIRQATSGGRLITFGSAFKFPMGSAPVLSTAASAVDLLVGVYDGVSLMCNLNKSFA